MTYNEQLQQKEWWHLHRKLMFVGAKDGKLYSSGGITIIIAGLVLIGLALVILFFLIAAIINIVVLIYRPVYILFFKLRHRKLLSEIKNLTEYLKDLFRMEKTISDAEIEKLLKDNERTIEEAKSIRAPRWESIIEKDMLNYWGIKEFLSLCDINYIKTKQEENNKVLYAVERLKQLSPKANEEFIRLMDKNHYFTYSEMVKLKESSAEIEELSTIIQPDYSKYITDEDSKKILNRIPNLANFRFHHNYDFIRRELTNNKTYFDTVLDSYPLDPQQRDSIVKLEDNCLVIASAGSGKTSTILGKAKYLVEKRNIPPSKILLITYTKKAANELHERMKIEGMTCCTFHKLAKDIIANVTGQAPSFCDPDLSLNIFHKLVESDKNFLHAINNYIINQQSLMGLEHDYYDAFSYFEDRKKYGIQALFPDIDGKIIFTRSEEEKRLVSILTRLGVPFRYENAYQYNTTTPERRQYRPDFTIYYQDSLGQWKWLYLEHFAVDSNGNVPEWFGEGSRGGWQYANRRYNEGIFWKRDIHRQNGTILIETKSADFRDGTVESKLKEQLRRYNVPIRERSDEELYQLLVKRSKSLERSVYTLILSFITLMKANEKTVDGLLMELEPKSIDNPLGSLIPLTPQNTRCKVILTDIIKPFYEEYEKTLHQNYQIDFTDAIIQAS